jgi:hypothetical protein
VTDRGRFPRTMHGSARSQHRRELPDAHRARRRRRVRARLDPRTHERGTRAGESPRCQARSQAETARTPEARSDLAARLSTASRCETSPAATSCRTARFSD